MENPERLFVEVLTALDHAGILQEFILIGGWCPVLYAHHFHHPPEISRLRTADIDLLIPNPPNIRAEVNVSGLLQQLGFELLTDYVSGHTKYSHPTLDVKFLIPELGRGQNEPYRIQQFHINAQGLRYLVMLQHDVMTIVYRELFVNMPEPAAYVLHKCIVSQERTDRDKREKDLSIARGISEFLIHDPEQRQRLQDIFKELPSKWQRTLLKVLKASDALFLLDLFAS